MVNFDRCPPPGRGQEHRPHAVAHAVQLDVSADGLDLPQKA